MEHVPDWLAAAMFTGIISGIITYGGVLVQLKWLRSDVENARRDAANIRAETARAHDKLERHILDMHVFKDRRGVTNG